MIWAVFSGSEGDVDEGIDCVDFVGLVVLVVCWPLALLVLVLFPVVWGMYMGFRVVVMRVEGVSAWGVFSK